MTFAWPHLLWLIVLPVALIGWELTRRRRAGATHHPKILRAEVGTHDLSLARDSGWNGKSHARPWLAAGLVFAIVAVARPQWGRIEEPVFDQSREILLAVDLSRSMMAPDVKPSRLERSKLLIQSLLEKLKGERVGLVVFSGTAFLQSPLSSDYEILREFLPALKPDFLPEGGTNYRALIDTSLDAFSASNAADRFLIVLSDGEATDDEWQSRVDELKKRGIRVIGLGVGTAAGSIIPDGTGGFVKDDRGAVVLSKLESGTLQRLAEVTGGVYRDASGWIDLASLVEQTVNAGRKGSFTEKNTARLVERFQWPLALALWCFVVSFYFEFPVRPRPRAVRLADHRSSRTTPPPDGNADVPAAPPAAVSCLAPFLISILVAGVAFAPALQAAVKVEPVPARPNEPRSANPPPAQETPLLGRIVGRLANADARSARDWAELAQETVSWGQRLQSSQQPVPEGPVRDALSAVALGSKLDEHTADWPKLQQELQDLLQKPEAPKPQQQNQSQQQKDQKDQPKQQDQNQSRPPENQPKSDQSQDQKQPPSQGQPQQPEKKQEQQESAFGDMKKQETPPPRPASETQKVGGTDEKKAHPKEQVDPALALPMEKLDQLRNQDSPAQLFELMQADRSQAPKKKNSKDW